MRLLEACIIRLLPQSNFPNLPFSATYLSAVLQQKETVMMETKKKKKKMLLEL
jgi:hypothetical protein